MTKRLNNGSFRLKEYNGLVLNRVKSIMVFVILGVFFTGKASYSQDISITGNWSLVIDASDLQSGAGTDLNPTYFSATDEISIDITNTITNWQVTVRGTASNWHGNFTFGLRRTTDGTGFGSISGGTAWLIVSGADQQFFAGSWPRWNIKVQCGLTGISLQIPPDTYIGTLIYTVTEI